MTASARQDAAALLLGSAAQEIAFRVAQVALPLVVLSETGSIALTGLVAGAEGLPVLLSPWWARTLRQVVCTGPRLTAVAVGDAIALSVTPTAAWLGVLGTMSLALAGLLLGIGEALGAPARTAMLADVGDRLGPDRAVTLVTAQDAVRRGSAVVGPTIGGLAVGTGLAVEALWVQAAAVLVSGLLAWRVRDGAERTSDEESSGTIRTALRTRPEVAVGWVLRGTFSLTWFAFVLGLSVLGEQTDRPGQLLAAGMTGYGVGALIGTAVATSVVRRLPLLRTARLTWSVAGLSWIAMAAWDGPVGVAACAFVAAAVLVVGIAAINATITRTSSGPTRRTLFSGQAAVVSATGSAGMLVGGSVIATLGVATTLVAAGSLAVVVAIVAPTLWHRAEESSRRRTLVSS